MVEPKGPAHQFERRHQPRLEVDQSAKIYDPRSRKYTACRVTNVSRAGALVELPWRMPYAAGDHLLLGVMTGPRQAVLRSVEMMEVEVARALTFTEGRTTIGVHFIHEGDVGLNLAKLAA